MKEIYNIAIIMSFLGIWFTSIVPQQFEEIFAIILIFSIGILHGSNDLLLIKNIVEKHGNYPFLKVLTVYTTTVVGAIVVFYFVPTLALSLFIVFSAFHFGEQHLEAKLMHKEHWSLKVLYFAYGLFILMLLFVFNKQEVVEVIQSITQYTVSVNIINYAFVITLAVLLLLSIHEFYRSKKFKSIVMIELFYLIIFAIIFKASTLIWGFAIYFILWHSIPSLFEQITFIYGSFNKKNIFNYIKNALPYWVISLIGLALVFFIFKGEKLFYALLFSFIAAVTFPHSLVINKMFKHKKTQPSDRE